MRTAKSARVHVILGASLAASIVPGQSIAELNTGQVDGIDSSSIRAIDSSSLLAIDSSSVWAVDSSSGQAIDSSSGQAIDSSSVWAIDSSSIWAIDSSSVIAIDSSSGRAIDSSSVIAIDSSSGQAIDSSSAMVLAGPVESIDYRRGEFVSLGQAVVLSGSGIDRLQIGDLVTVSGSVAGPGRINADVVALTNTPYVPGDTEIYVTGIPTSVDSTLGTATIGKLTFDYTPSLSGNNFEGIGAAITVIGTQPALGGIVLSNQVLDRTELFFTR